jgi:hypothetical protein
MRVSIAAVAFALVAAHDASGQVGYFSGLTPRPSDVIRSMQAT